MAEVVRKDRGIHTAHRISHVFIMGAPTYPKPLFITDAAVNIFPTLEGQGGYYPEWYRAGAGAANQLTQGRHTFSGRDDHLDDPLDNRRCGAVQDGRAGQITGAVVDRPLALDNAISPDAAAIRHVTSSVAGDADILLVPDLEAGNMFANEISFLANADTAGIVLVARVSVFCFEMA